MRNLLGASTGVLAPAALLLWTVLLPGAEIPKTRAKTNSLPRMSDGHPDLQGTWDGATLTPLERAPGAKAVLTKEEVLKLETAAAAQKELGDRPIQGDRSAPTKGGERPDFAEQLDARTKAVLTAAGGGTGGYNYGWLDPGSTYTVVNGEKRSSLIVDPPNGRIPPITRTAAQRGARSPARPTSDARESNDPALETGSAYDDPERRPLGERCLLGFGSTSGPPALPNYFYNNLHQIVQTPKSVMILTEMVHDARTVRMNAQHLPKNIRQWLGDSVGHWEGDTLVIDTTNFTDKTRFAGSTADLHVVERLTRVDDKTLLYRFTIDDPATWAQPWSGEYTWIATNSHIYEYACHEANYAMKDILKGARLREKEAATQAGK